MEKMTLNPTQKAFIENRVRKLDETNQAIMQLNFIMKEKQSLANELNIIIKEYVATFGFDPETRSLDLKNNLILKKIEKEKKNGD